MPNINSGKEKKMCKNVKICVKPHNRAYFLPFGLEKVHLSFISNDNNVHSSFKMSWFVITIAARWWSLPPNSLNSEFRFFLLSEDVFNNDYIQILPSHCPFVPPSLFHVALTFLLEISALMFSNHSLGTAKKQLFFERVLENWNDMVLKINN